MKIEVLGCYGNVTRRCRSTAFLINDHMLFDAGRVTEVLPAERLRLLPETVFFIDNNVVQCFGR
jgi:hypothetical protein